MITTHTRSTKTRTARADATPPPTDLSERYSKMYTRNHNLKPMPFKVFAAIKELAFDGETRTLDLFGIAQIAQCSVASVSAALPQIVAAGYITFSRPKTGRGYCYTITVLTRTAGPQHPAPAAGAFFVAAEGSANDQLIIQPADVSAMPVSPIPITQTAAEQAAPDQQINRLVQQQQQSDDGEMVNTRADGQTATSCACRRAYAPRHATHPHADGRKRGNCHADSYTGSRCHAHCHPDGQ